MSAPRADNRFHRTRYDRELFPPGVSDREAVNLAFLPGLTTVERATKVSGRGVGMDVVRTNIERIGGTVEVASVLGEGTTVRIRIPLKPRTGSATRQPGLTACRRVTARGGTP